MSIILRETFATIADKTEMVGCNSNDDDVCGAINGLEWSASIKIGIVYADAFSRPRYKVVNDQSEHRCEDSGDPCNGSQNKTDSGRLIECLKRGV